MYQLEKRVLRSLALEQRLKILILLNLLKKPLILRLKDKLKSLKREKRLFKKQDFTIVPKMKHGQCDRKNLQMTIGIFQNLIFCQL